MPKHNEIIRVYKIEYSPSQYEKNAYAKQLIVELHGITRSGKRVKLNVSGCRPRIWVPEDPKNVFIPAEVKHYITGIERQGVSFIGKKPLWCIYVKYPFSKLIYSLRDCFSKHYQADVPFAEAVRPFYGIKDYIRIPKGKRDLNINEIETDINQEYKFELNHYILDIETSDVGGFADPTHPTAPIRCLSLVGVKKGDIHHFITKDEDENTIIDRLKDSEFLTQSTKHDEGIKVKPIGDVSFNIYKTTQGDPEERECNMLHQLANVCKSLGITTICEFAGYDVAYITERIKVKNKAIVRWNHKHNGDRRYYPRHIFKPINVTDIESFYTRFISGSPSASGRAALEWVCREELGHGKILRYGIDDMYDNDPELLSIYNLCDCIFPDRVMKKLGELVEVHQSVCDYMGTEIKNWNKPMMQWETKIMHILKNKEILHSVKYVPRDSGMEAGGLVTEKAPSGLFENMIELDNSGEYNAVVMTGHIDYETFIKDGDEVPKDVPIATFPSGRRYRLDIPGIIPETLREMVEQINEYKRQIKAKNKEREELYKDKENNKDAIKKIETEIKVLDRLKYVPKSGTLSATGLYGTSSEYTKEGKERKRPFRLANGGFASDITDCGRHHERWNKIFIENHTLFYKPMYVNGEFIDFYMILLDEEKSKNPIKNCGELGCIPLNLVVIYQDTDSCKCRIEGKLPELNNDKDLKSFLNKLGDIYCKALNESFDEFAEKTLGVKEHYFMIKLDAIYKKYFQWGANKNYVYKDFEGKITPKGVRLVKRGTPFITQKFMREFFEVVMEDITMDEVLDKISDMMNQYKSDILNGKYIRECGAPRGVKSRTYDYDSMVHSNSIFNKDFKLGDVAVFYPAKGLKGHPLPKNKQVALEWGDDPSEFGIFMDYDHVFQKLKESMKKILTGLYPDATWESISDGVQQGNIDESDIW